MAWQCSASSNDQLIDNLISHRLLSTSRVIEAFRKIDRAAFVGHDPYLDAPQVLQRSPNATATISAPHMHACAVENLAPFCKIGGKVLDVGSGSGILLAIFHHLVESNTSLVVGIDHLPSLVTLARDNLARSSPFIKAALDSGHIRLCCADGRQGVPPELLPAEFQGFDAIHVGAAARSLPDALVAQLKRGGRMWIPLEDDVGNQSITTVDKTLDGEIVQTKLFGVRYVPLTDRVE